MMKPRFIRQRKSLHDLLVNPSVPRDTPACFESDEQYRRYLEQGRIASGSGVQDICRDCTATYQTAMIAAARCAHPETIFVPLEQADGGHVYVGLSGPQQGRYARCSSCGLWIAKAQGRYSEHLSRCKGGVIRSPSFSTTRRFED